MKIEEIKQKAIEIRHHLHQYPKTAMEEYETSKYIAETMREFGFEVHEGIGKTGVVAILKNGTSNRMIGLRCDMDALPIQEMGNPLWKSKVDGKFHGCGHDSHVASMIATALLLKERRNFDGSVAFIFQPGEEPGVGAKAMIEDGLFEKFPIQEIYGQHQNGLLEYGKIKTKSGIFSSSEADFWITIKGKGGHASAPQNLNDPIVVAGELIGAMQTIISRNVNPLESGTISICDVSTDGAMNAVASTVKLLGDCRTYNSQVEDMIEKRMQTIIEHVCTMYNCDYEFKFERVFIPMDNNEMCVKSIQQAAREYDDQCILENVEPSSGSEDFAYYQRVVPAAFFYVGTKQEGKDSYPNHNGYFDFNDDAILIGPQIMANIIKNRMPINK